jgi:DNA-binding PadR family transcriptional regulator
MQSGLSGLEYHVLLAMAVGPRHGYAIREAVEAESAGTLAPGAGSLYRVLARLLGRGLLEESAAPRSAGPSPGLERRYYRLTAVGRDALAVETRRLRSVAALAAKRLGALEDDRG